MTVWCAVSNLGVWGHYFFKERSHSVTVTSDRYVEMLQTFLEPKLRDLGNQDVWFQQAGATAHTARTSMKALSEMFPGRLISLHGDIGWPAHSPDLSPCDYFLWGYLKNKVYKYRPGTIEELKDAICQKVAEIPPEMTLRVMENFRNHLQQCIVNRGYHLEDVIFKTK